MKESLISLRTAKLAKKKGCELELCTCGGFPECICKDKRITQSLLQKWLRDIHGIHIILVPVDDKTLWIYTLEYINPVKEYGAPTVKDWKTYEGALEEGLYQALRII